MATDHKNIVDAERHEVKGASTASSGQVLKADGDGTTSFVNPSTLTNIVVSDVLSSRNTASQNPSSTDTPLTIVFGSASSATDVSISAGGVLTFNTAGFYIVTTNLTLGKGTGVGIASLIYRALVNGSPIEPAYATTLPTDGTVVSKQIILQRSFSAGATLSFQILRDSAEDDFGGLVAINPTLSGWNDVPSASVDVQKVTGAS